MSLTSLDQVINTGFVQKLVKASGQKSTSPATSSGSSAADGQALYTSLRVGAKSFSMGVQLLNRGISVINVSLDLNQKLLSIVNGIERLVDRANKGNLSASSSKEYRSRLDMLTRSFDAIVKKADASDINPLDVTELERTLVSAGLDKEKIGELAAMLKKIASPGKAITDSNGNVISDGSPLPVEDIRRQLQAAIFDEDEPSDDRSGFFSRARSKLRDVKSLLETNIKAIERTRDFVKVNLDLVRATGLALLDVSNSMTGRESAEELAAQVRSAIRASAPGALSQAGHLNGVLVASLAQSSE